MPALRAGDLICAFFELEWSMLDIVTIGAEVLTRAAEPVKDFDQGLKDFIERMFDAMRVGRGIGLAAPQVAVGKRIFVVQVEDDVPRVFVNPELVRTGERIVSLEEGCLSIPGVYADVKRSAEITVQAWNERGRPFTLDADGLLARVVLHELDHLNGVLFVDRLPEAAKAKVLAQYEKRRRY